jgi:adenylate cyclase, class 2
LPKYLSHMAIVNVEFKAKSNHIRLAEQKLLELNPRFAGEDHQIDTYFNVIMGRLKLREGNIENALIYYERPNDARVKVSDTLLYKCNHDFALKEVLTKSLAIRVIVSKKRRIYYVQNVKIHFDQVKGLGEFIEVEACDNDAEFANDFLTNQCEYFKNFFDVKEADLISCSYSDLLKFPAH